MKLVRNTGNDRVVDLVSTELATSHSLDVVTPHLSLFGFAALREFLTRIVRTRMILPPSGSALVPEGDTNCVSRDGAFVDDVAKTNLAAILDQRGFVNVCSL